MRAKGRNRKRARPAWALLLCSVLTVAVVPPSAADDHDPPRASLEAPPAGSQNGARYQYVWVEAIAGGCGGMAGDGPTLFPAPLHLEPGSHSGTVVLAKAAAPVELQLFGWRRVDRRGFPRGRGAELAHTLAPRPDGSGGVSAWAASFSFELGARDHLYLNVFARWRDEEGCDGPEDPPSQNADWGFHLASTPIPTCRGREATIEGTPYRDRADFDDIIVGTEGADVIAARKGNDKVLGRGGDDLICGRGGDDSLHGAEGDDRIFGSLGRDDIAGGAGRDRCRGGKGDDRRDCER